jgi:hypothetical protein
MCPRDRSRGRVARPDDTAPAEDGSDDPEDDDDPTPDLSERDGTIDDLLDDQVGNVEQQVLSGSQADLRIAPEVNPGFVDTEVVNRMGLVLSLNLEFDPSRQQWVPAVVDKTERQAVEQALVEDRASDDLSGPVDTGDGTNVNSDGDLELAPDGDAPDSWQTDSPNTFSTTDKTGIQLSLDEAVDSVTVRIDPETCTATHAYVHYYSGNINGPEPIADDGTVTLSWDSTAGYSPDIYVDAQGSSYQSVEYQSVDLPIQRDGYKITDGSSGGGTNLDYPVAFAGAGDQLSVETGEATSSFDNPCTASSTRSVQHDVCSKSSDVTVDLYNGDPNSSDSTLLARDIDQREDITDLPDAFTDLQYKITLNRDDSGESPKVSRLGHQLIR